MKIVGSMSKQLLLIYLIIIVLLSVSLGFLLPNTLLPIYEENLYNRLRQPLAFIGDVNDFSSKNHNDIDIAYIYINNDDTMISDNLEDVVKFNDISDITNNISKKYGNFNLKGRTYYYYTMSRNYETKISITDNSYINELKSNIIGAIFSIVGITFVIISIIIIVWSNYWASRIKKIKEKLDNINNDDYKSPTLKFNDELHTLDVAIDNMKVYLKEQEEYKNQMYQNISHDFKTPIAVIKSYIEASEDGVESQEKVLSVIKDQTNKLESKVHSLLYLNKLNYIKDKKDYMNESYDVSLTINTAVEKFKRINSNIDFVLDIDEKSTNFRGSADMWEAIIENILNNFLRYAKKRITITVKNGKISLFNDGPHIDKDVLNNIFTPYEKGVNGVFGLGLSIVKKTLSFLGYDINITNVKNGVKFTISE